MPVTSVHAFTVSGTQYDLRQAVMWAPESADVIRVLYRGAPEGAWIRHDLAAWIAAKQASLGTTIALSPHIFTSGSTSWDLRFATMWNVGTNGAVRVYYEAVNSDTWVTHPDITTWLAKKQTSLNAEV